MNTLEVILELTIAHSMTATILFLLLGLKQLKRLKQLVLPRAVNRTTEEIVVTTRRSQDALVPYQALRLIRQSRKVVQSCLRRRPPPGAHQRHLFGHARMMSIRRRNKFRSRVLVSAIPVWCPTSSQRNRQTSHKNKSVLVLSAMIARKTLGCQLDPLSLRDALRLVE